VPGVRRWSWWQIGKKMEGHCSTGQSPQWAVVPMEEDEEGQEIFHISWNPKAQYRVYKSP